MLNDYKLDQYCASIAEELVNYHEDLDEALDHVWEYADGSEYVIYYAKAHELCRTCNTDMGEDFIADCYSDVPMTYDEMACRIAYGEIENRIRCAVEEMFEAKEAA